LSAHADESFARLHLVPEASAASQQLHRLQEFNGKPVSLGRLMIYWQRAAHSVPGRIAKIQTLFDDSP
jgi:hypothetical protein